MTQHELDRPLVLLVLAMGLGAMMPTLDATVVNVGVHTLGESLHADLATTQWIGTGYLLAVAISAPLAGWAVDRFGGRRIWGIGLSAFIIGSLLCSVAWSIESLIACRVAQGMGAGLVEPTMLTVLARAAGPHRLGRVMALTSAPITVGPALGPIVGGTILAHLSWRWLFLANVPIGLMALTLSARFVPAQAVAETERHRLDFVGLVLIAPGFAAVLYAWSQTAGPSGFASPRVLIFLAIGVCLIAAFVAHALRTTVAPLIDVRLFRNRAFAASATIMALVGAIFFGALFLLPLYFQEVHGRGVLAAGVLLAPLGCGALLSMSVAGRVADRYGPRIPACLAMASVGLGASMYALSGQGTSEIWLGGCAALIGFSLPLAATPILSALYYTVPPAAASSATSSMYILNQMGASLGIAVVALVLQQQLQVGRAADAAFSLAFWWLAGGAALGVLGALLLPAKRLGEPAESLPVGAAVATEAH